MFYLAKVLYNDGAPDIAALDFSEVRYITLTKGVEEAVIYWKTEPTWEKGILKEHTTTIELKDKLAFIAFLKANNLITNPDFTP